MSVRAVSDRRIPGGVRILDYRGTGLCPPNGGRIRPLALVHHIPVIRQAPGREDGITLGRVLKQQGLAVQAGTDAEGIVFRYTNWTDLCYHAKGGNKVTLGIEHMHYTTSEPWTELQYRAAAWISYHVWNSLGIRPERAEITAGAGTIGVAKRGHTSHQTVAAKAGYHDRSDPGKGFAYGHLYELTRFYAKHKRF